MPLSSEERQKLIAKLERMSGDTRRSQQKRAEWARAACILRKMQQRIDEREKRNRTPEFLEHVSQAASEGTFQYCKSELGYRHMLALAETFESWVLDRRLSPEQTARLLGWSEALRRIADEVGAEWDPTPPERLSALGYLGRYVLEE